MWWCWGPESPASPRQRCWPVRAVAWCCWKPTTKAVAAPAPFGVALTPLMPEPPRWLALSLAAAINACLPNWGCRCRRPHPSTPAVWWISPMGTRPFGFGGIQNVGGKNGSSTFQAVSASGSSASAYTPATGPSPGGDRCCRRATAGTSASCCAPLAPAMCSAGCSARPRWPTYWGSAAAAALGTSGCGGFWICS